MLLSLQDWWKIVGNFKKKKKKIKCEKYAGKISTFTTNALPSQSRVPRSFCCLFGECLLIRFSGAPVFGHMCCTLSAYEYEMRCNLFFLFFYFLGGGAGRFSSFFSPSEWSGLQPPSGFELGDACRYPENSSLLKGSRPGNACIRPVGAEFWWGLEESNLLIAVVFQLPHYFY